MSRSSLDAPLEHLICVWDNVQLIRAMATPHLTSGASSICVDSAINLRPHYKGIYSKPRLFLLLSNKLCVPESICHVNAMFVTCSVHFVCL
jgi:hypothetical protein